MLGQRKIAARNPQIIASINDGAWKGYGLLMIPDQHDSEIGVGGPVVAASQKRDGQENTASRLASTVVGNYGKKPNKQKAIPPLLSYESSDTSSQHSPPMRLPLSADHCLITLVQYNVVRAMLFNMSILSMMDCFPLGCGRALQIPYFGAIAPDMIPSDLQPTPLQKSTSYPFWINAIPFPRLRDNLIRMLGQYDSDGLLYDLGQGLYEGFDDAERRGYLVWGDPWSADGWEVSEGFVRKWGFLLAGCVDVIESTNRWRDVRGEERLILEI